MSVGGVPARATTVEPRITSAKLPGRRAATWRAAEAASPARTSRASAVAESPRPRQISADSVPRLVADWVTRSWAAWVC